MRSSHGPDNIECLVFSPTGGCLGMAKGIKESLEGARRGCTVRLRDITQPTIREELRELPAETGHVVIVFPVYADSLPDILAEYLQGLSIRNLPVTLVAGFGNIGVGKALSKTRKILEGKGNRVCSACAIVTEHSYNGDRLSIAAGQPSAENREILYRFIQGSIDKAGTSGKLDSLRAAIPEGRMRLVCRAPQTFFPRLFIKIPAVVSDRCDRCMACARKCPAGAIDTELNVDGKSCIRCLACVKYCTRKARLFETRTRMLLNTLKKDSIGVKANEYYL
jgi:ferredoxin